MHILNNYRRNLIGTLLLFLFNLNLFAADVKKTEAAQFGFIENKGQIIDQYNNLNREVLYLYTTRGFKVQLKRNSFSYELYKAERLPCSCDSDRMKFPNTPDFADYKFYVHRIDFSFVGANSNPDITTDLASTQYLNYYTTATPEAGVLNVRNFKKVIYHNIYPNIDIEFILSGEQFRNFKYNIVVHPGGNINDIKLKLEGANNTSLSPKGSISIVTSQGDIEEKIPYSFQLNNKNNQETVEAKFKQLEASIFGIDISEFNPDKTITIDPTPWATFFGGSLAETSYGINRDATSNVYITGTTLSTNNMATTGAFQVAYGGATDAYLTKFSQNGALVWSTFLGGTALDLGYVITFDSIGNLLLGGTSVSTTGIATTGAFQATNAGLQDCFIEKFTTAGTRIWGTYYGGSGANEIIYGMVADSGFIYASGYTNVTTGTAMATAGSYQPAYGTGAYDAFIVKFTAAGNRVWGTYYGGTGDDRATNISRDKNGDLIISGQTTSTASMATAGTFISTYAGSIMGYVAKFNSAGNRIWGTYFGGTQNTVCVMAVPDATGSINVGGYTGSTSGIASAGSFQPALGGGPAASPYDGFIARLNSTGSRLWGSYYGGTDYDVAGFGMAVDPYGNILLSGYSASLTGISSIGSYQPVNAGGTTGTAYDGFVVKFDSLGNRKWCTFYGGPGTDYARGVATDIYGYVYFTGYGASLTGIATAGAFQASNAGPDDAYVVILNDDGNFRPKSYNDAGVLSIDSPALFCSGSQSIKATIRNFGLNQINPVTVKWSLNGILQPPVTYSSILDTAGKPNNSVQLTLGSYVFPTAPATIIKAWTYNPNNVTDTVPINDSATAIKLPSLNGSFTIDPAGSGANNFTTFTSAAAALNLAGVCGPVVFTIAPGIYNEKVTLGSIAGASAVNNIIFNGVDTATRKLVYNETAVPTNPGVINIQGANYVTFKNLGIIAQGTSTSIGVNIQSGTNNNILNCNIRVSSISTGTSCFGVGICGNTYTTTSLSSNNIIQNCVIIGGYVGVSLYGTSTTSFTSGNNIKGCTISEVYYAGILSYYQTFDTIIDNKMTVRLTAIANYGIYSYYNQNVRMERNYIYGFSYMGIYAYYNNSSATVRMAIANNIINLNGPYIYTTQQGINAVTCNTVDIIHNTVYTVGAGSGSYACNITPGTAGVVIKNNIFHSTGSSSGALSVSTPTGLTACDHNILFSNFTTLATWAAANYIDVASLRSASAPYNVNTFNKFSNFVSVVNQAENLHLTSTVAADYGDANYSTALDFDGETRCAFAPTIGADESKFGSGVPTANFTQSDTIFVNSPVTLLNNNGVGSPLTHKWYIDGVFKGSTVDLPCQFSATGSYSIKLVTTGCFGIDSITRSITVFNATQAPIANFISDVNTVETYQNVTFKDLTVKGPTYWNWSFVPSTGVNYNFSTTNHSSSPIVNFSNPGLYQVCLWDSNDVGRSNTECKTAYILVRSTSTMCIFPFDTKVSSGTLYDDGGPNGNYGPNHLAANPCNFLIDPCASSVTLSFSSFNLGLNAFLKVYDGKDKYGTPLHTAAGVPNGFTGTTFPPTLTASSGKMYIEFITATTLAPGFAATWSSVAGNYPVPSGTVNFPDTLYDCGAMTDFTFVPNNPLFEKDGAYYRWYFDYDHSAIADIEGKGYYTTQWAYSSLGSYIIRCEVEGCGGTLVLQDTVYVAHPSGPPVINFNADITTATTNDVVTLSDLSRNGPVARKWKITGPSIPSTVSGNTTTKTYAVRFTAPGYYSVSLRDSNCISSDSLTKTNYIKIINYCTPAVSTLNPDFALERTKFGRTDTIVNNTVPGFQYINSTPALGTIAYRDNTDKFAAYNIGNVSITKGVEAIVDLGGTFSFATTRVSNYNKANFNIWIDYDQDGVFQSTELVASSGPIPGRTFSGNITIPLNAKIGNTRMRIATAFNNSSNTPCGANQYGEFNDFRIRVIPDMIKPVISFTGSDTLYVEVGRTFVEPGFSVTDNTTIPCPYTVTGIASGTQIVKHPSNFSYMVTATDATGNTSTRTRVVRSSPDITKPVITRIGTSPYYVEVKGIYNDSGATASDFFFGNFTPYIFSIMNVDVNKLGTYGVTYDVTDSSGNKATQVIRTVIVRDTQKPVITLNTADTIYLNVFAPFVPPVVTVTDNYNTGLTYTTTGGPVNNSVIGTYVLNYNVTDSSGNSALTKKLTVIVRDTKAPSILLNFGDTFVIDVNTMTTVPEPGYTLSDNYYQSGALTLVVSYANVMLNIVGYYPVRYYITDPSGNMDSSHIRVFKIVDRVAPQINLFGPTYVIWPRWKPYVDAGNLVTDNYYTNLLCTPDISKVNIYLPGIYEVTFDITDPSGNKAKQEKRSIQITADANGIAGKNDDNLFAVYPNPNNGMVNIDLNIAGTKEGSILIFDATGRIVYTSSKVNPADTKLQLDLSNEAAGMYFIKVVTESYSASKTFSIQH